MPHKLGTLVLFLAAALPIAFSTPPARADAEFHMPSLGNLEGSRTGADRFLVNGIEIGCEEVTYRGAAEGSSKTLAIEPEFDECTAETLSRFPADFFQELCVFVLHDAKRIEGKALWRAGVDIRCSGGYTAVGWDLFETQARYKVSHQFCSVRMPQQAGVGTAVLRNLGGQHGGIEVRWSLDFPDYTVSTPGGDESSLVCGSTLGGAAGGVSYSGAARVMASSGIAPTFLSVSG